MVVNGAQPRDHLVTVHAEMEFASADGTVASTNTLAITDAAHALANGPAGAVSGNVTYASAATNMGAAADSTLPASAQKVAARGSSTSGESAVFAFETGATLDDGSAATCRRVAMGYDDAALSTLTTDAWKVFDNAVHWAVDSTYSYDTNGNLTAGRCRTYSYNSANQTTQINSAGHTYAGSNQFERLTSGTTSFTDTVLGVGTRDGEFSRSDVFSRDNGGELTGRYRFNSDGSYHERDYYLTDALGSIVALTNASGNVDKRYSYDPYGVTAGTDSTGTAMDVAADSNPWRYAGTYQDRSTGIYKMGHRYYDPAIGRFTQVDPSQQEQNWYLYASGNPLNFTDPTGLLTQDELASALDTLGIALGFAALLASGGAAAGLALAAIAAGGIAGYLQGGARCAVLSIGFDALFIPVGVGVGEGVSTAAGALTESIGILGGEGAGALAGC